MRKVEEYNTAATRSFHSDINFFSSLYMFNYKRISKKLVYPFLATMDLSDKKLSLSKVSKYL